MAEAIMSFSSVIKSTQYSHNTCSLQSTKLVASNPLSIKSLRQSTSSSSTLCNGFLKCSDEGGCKNKRAAIIKMKALPDLTLMAVLVEHMEGQRDLITHKSIWHLSDTAMKNVYTFYIMFTCWGCCFFGAAKDPYYDSEQYRKDGGDGTGHWVYEKQEDIEESARAELWREELIEEIEQKVGGLRELEEAGKKEEELVR